MYGMIKTDVIISQTFWCRPEQQICFYNVMSFWLIYEYIVFLLEIWLMMPQGKDIFSNFTSSFNKIFTADFMFDKFENAVFVQKIEQDNVGEL